MIWAKACHVEREALFGGSFNGNSCHKLLSRVDALRAMCPIQALPYVDCFSAFQKVVHSCYGDKLDANYKLIIQNFAASYLQLGISVTPKVHAVFHHIMDFCEVHNVGLGRFSEQSVEAVHSDFKTTWSRYKVAESNPAYSSQLLKAVRDYNSKHL